MLDHKLVETSGISYVSIESYFMIMRKVYERWVPKMLTDEMKESRVTQAYTLLTRYNRDYEDYHFSSFTAFGNNNRFFFAYNGDPDETAHNNHQDLRCLTFSFSTLHIRFFPIAGLFKKKKKKKKKKM